MCLILSLPNAQREHLSKLQSIAVVESIDYHSPSSLIMTFDVFIQNSSGLPLDLYLTMEGTPQMYLSVEERFFKERMERWRKNRLKLLSELYLPDWGERPETVEVYYSDPNEFEKHCPSSWLPSIYAQVLGYTPTPSWWKAQFVNPAIQFLCNVLSLFRQKESKQIRWASLFDEKCFYTKSQQVKRETGGGKLFSIEYGDYELKSVFFSRDSAEPSSPLCPFSSFRIGPIPSGDSPCYFRLSAVFSNKAFHQLEVDRESNNVSFRLSGVEGVLSSLAQTMQDRTSFVESYPWLPPSAFSELRDFFIKSIKQTCILPVRHQLVVFKPKNNKQNMMRKSRIRYRPNDTHITRLTVPVEKSQNTVLWLDARNQKFSGHIDFSESMESP